MPWPQRGSNYYYAQLELPDNSRANKGLDVCSKWNAEPFGSAKRFEPRLFSTFLLGIDRIEYTYL